MARKNQDAWGGLDEAPAAKVRVPSTSRNRMIKFAVFTVLGAGIMTPLILIAGIGTISDALHQKSTTQTQPVVSSPGRAAATIALTSWLGSSPAPVVDGQIISWDGATTVPAVVTVDQNGKTISPSVKFISEIDTFSVVDGFGQQYSSAVQVQVDPRTNTGVAVGSPSLLPVATKATDSWQVGGPWPGLSTVTVSDTAVKAATGWATAYASGDGSALRIAVGDPDPNHQYTALSGVDQVTAAVLTGALPNPADPSVMIVQVKLLLHWTTQPPLTPAQQVSKDRPGVVLDLLVERANTAAPVITAWGAPGSGTTLHRYGNAVDGEGRVQSTLPPTMSATPTSNPSAQTSRS